MITFNVWLVRANAISSSSALTIGTNLLLGFGSSTKEMNGNGEVNGDFGLMPTQTAGLDDRDVLDMPWVMEPLSSMGQVDGLLPTAAPCAMGPAMPLWPGSAPVPAVATAPGIPLWPPTY